MIQSAFAMIGIMFTLLSSCFIVIRSTDFKLKFKTDQMKIEFNLKLRTGKEKKRLKSSSCKSRIQIAAYLRVTCGSNEVETGVDSSVVVGM